MYTIQYTVCKIRVKIRQNTNIQNIHSKPPTTVFYIGLGDKTMFIDSIPLSMAIKKFFYSAQQFHLSFCILCTAFIVTMYIVTIYTIYSDLYIYIQCTVPFLSFQQERTKELKEQLVCVRKWWQCFLIHQKEGSRSSSGKDQSPQTSACQSHPPDGAHTRRCLQECWNNKRPLLKSRLQTETPNTWCQQGRTLMSQNRGVKFRTCPNTCPLESMKQEVQDCPRS